MSAKQGGRGVGTGGGAKHAPHAPRVPFALVLLGLVAAGLCALLALNTASAANEVHRHDIAAADQSVAAQLVDLHNQAQASAAPGNLAAAAQALGMVPAGNPAFLEIGPDGTVKVLGSPAPASAPPVYIPSPTKHAKPKPTTSKTATTTSSKTAPKSAGKSTPKSTGKSTPTSTAKSTTRPAPKTTPHPSPTPTPESTLPGGAR
jgi:hypothetical protein